MKAGWLLSLLVAGAALASNPTTAVRTASDTDKAATPRDDAKFVSITMTPDKPKVGDVGDFIVTVTNTGTTKWTWRNSFHHDAVGFGPTGGKRNYKGEKPETVRISHPGGEMPGDDKNPFDGNRLTLRKDETIEPGATKRFGGRVEYKQAGTYRFMVQMVKENGKAQGQKRPRPDGWFGESVEIEVTVVNK